MNRAFIFRGRAYEDHSSAVLAYVNKAKGVRLLQAHVSSITCTITDSTTGTAVTGFNGVSLSPSAVIYDTLQTDDDWELDDTGYNFRHDLSTSALPNGSRTYLYRTTIVTTDGVSIAVWGEIESQAK
jgi:hypothetical protein